MFDLDAIRAIKDVTIKAVEIPEWSITLHVRSLPSFRRDQFDRATNVADPGENFRARLVAYCLCDPEGLCLFDEPEPAAYELGQRCASAVGALWRAAAAVNGLSREAIEENEKKTASPAGDAVQVSASQGPGANLPGAG